MSMKRQGMHDLHCKDASDMNSKVLAERVYFVLSEPLARSNRASPTEDESHPHGD